MLRSFAASWFQAETVEASKRGLRVSVCLPAKNEASTVGAVVEVIAGELMGRTGVVDELVVVDDGSDDATAEVATAAGAKVVAAGEVLADLGTDLGKGGAMWAGLQVTTGDVVAFCDADVRSFHAGFVLGLVGPLLLHPELALVKGFYERPLDGRPGEGGRVTELMARPLVSVLFPHLGPIVQPLAGEVAARRDVFEAVPFVSGYGVDLGLLIDVSERWGTDALAQCHLGERVHRNRSLAELSAQATAVLQVGLARAGLAGTAGEPWTTGLQRPDGAVVPVTMRELPPLQP